jgi:Ca2+-dependent lipid-binding protein
VLTCVPPRLQGYIESLTAALKRLEGENEVLKQQQTDNHAMFAMLDGNQSTQVLQEKNSAIKAQQQQIASLERQVQALKDDNGQLSRALDLKQAEVSSLKSELMTPKAPSLRESELVSALQMVEQQRFAMTEKLRKLELDAEEHQKAGKGQQQMIQQLISERDDIAARYARLEQLTGAASANGHAQNSVKKNMQLSIQLEVAQKEARVAHSQLIRLRSELQALKDGAKSTVEGDETEAGPVLKRHAKMAQRSAPAPPPAGGAVQVDDSRVTELEAAVADGKAQVKELERFYDSRVEELEAAVVDGKVQMQELERLASVGRAEVQQMQAALSAERSKIREMEIEIQAKEAQINTLRSKSGNDVGKNEVAELVGLVTQLRGQVETQKAQLDDVTSQLQEKQRLVDQQQWQLKQQDEAEGDMPVLTKKRGAVQRSAAPPPGGQAKRIVELEDQLRQIQLDLNAANTKLAQQSQELKALRGGSDKQVQQLSEQIEELQGKLSAAERDLETKQFPAPEVKKELLLNIGELEPLMPKILPVSRRPPHPLQYFDAPTRIFGASSSAPNSPGGDDVPSPAKTSQQELAEVRAELNRLKGTKTQVQQRIDQLRQKAPRMKMPATLSGKLSMTVHAVNNVPKLDTFGHADPYCTIQLMQITEKTKKFKNEKNPQFEDTFELPVSQVPSSQNVVLTLMEWNRFGKDKAVGTINLPLGDIAERGSMNRQQVPMKAAGKEGDVTGPNNQLCIMLYSVTFVSDVPLPTPQLAPDDQAAVDEASIELARVTRKITDAEAKIAALGGSSPARDDKSGPWQLRLGLIRAQHLPKMDLTGAADPYVTFDIMGEKQRKSKTIKNTLSPEWREEFVFDITDDKGELVLTVWDYDQMSKDEVIGEVRFRLADLSGKSSTNHMNLTKPGTAKTVMGKDGEKSVITISLSASNASPVVDPLGRGGVAADSTVPLTVSLKLDAPFDETVGNFDKKKAFREGFAKELAQALGVGAERITVLNLQRGSVIVDINVLPDIDVNNKKTPESLTRLIMEQVALMDRSPLGKLPLTGKIIGCTVQNRRGQLEAENAFLVEQNGLLTSALTQIEKVQKLQKSEKADRILFRWKNKGLNQCFQRWKHVVEMEAVARELKEQAEKDMAGVSNELDATKKQLDANNAHVKDQLNMLKESRQLALEDVEKAQNEAKAAMAKAEEEKLAAQAAAREVAEKQHELEARLRKRLTEMKLQGGGPRIKLQARKAEHLPKMDTFGWIDGYLSITLGDDCQKTKIIKKKENPEWNEDFYFSVTDTTGTFKITLLDWEMTSAHRAVGELLIKAADVVQNKTMDKIFELRNADGSIVKGKNDQSSLLHLGLTYEEKGDKELEAMQKEMEELQRQKAAKDADVANAEAALEDAKDGLRVKPPFKIKVNIKALRHLPQMDTFGKCDGYVIVQCGDQKQRTDKKKNDYNPDFNETFEFNVTKSSQSLSVKVMDWETSGNDEEVGSNQIQVGKLMAGTVDHELTLIGTKNQNVVIGKDKEKTTVLFSVTVEPPARSTGQADGMSAVATGSAVAPWKLKVKLLSAENLPQMDTFGKCDGYVVMSVAGERKTSKTIKNEYNPQWHEEFEFEVTDNSDEFIAKVWDWDLGCQDDEVGSVQIPLSELHGKEEAVEKVLNVQRDGQMVVGKNKNPTKLNLMFWYMKIEGAVAPVVEVDDGSPKEPVRGILSILARGADGLPKMDSWTGKADPYLVITVDGVTQKTTCKKGTLTPAWDETFDFRCIANKSVVKVEMFDQEKMGKDRSMGSFSVPVRNLVSYPKETYPLQGTLYDGSACSGKVHLKLLFKEASNDSSGGASLEATGPGVWVKVLSANNLPKMDTFGKCDPKVQIEIDGQVECTDKKSNCYDAEFSEPPYNFPTSGSASIVEVTVFDHDDMSGNDKVGSCAIDLSLAGKNGVLSGEFNVVKEDGSPVIGNSKKPCTVSLSIKINPLPSEDDGEESDEDAADVWDIEVTAIKFMCMPKMDVMGSCDCYLKMSIQNQERRTKDVTGYEGEWHESVRWDAIKGRNCNLLIEAYDKVPCHHFAHALAASFPPLRCLCSSCFLTAYLTNKISIPVEH